MFQSDWQKLYENAEAIEKDLSVEDLEGTRREQFKFMGCGWYITEEDTILVLPLTEEDKMEKAMRCKRFKGPFYVFVWNRPDARRLIHIVFNNAPIRQVRNVRSHDSKGLY